MAAPPPMVTFGTFEFDPSTGELRRGGQRVPLQDQPAQVLSLLVGRPGEVVTREELRRALWTDDTFVDFDTALNVAVNKIRQALRDSAMSPRFVETVPKRGYRFLADVHEVEPQGDASPVERGSTEPPSRRSRWWVAAAAGVLIVALGVGVIRFARARVASTPRSVAVLPFRPLDAGDQDEALQTGMAEAVIVKLARQPTLRVPSIGAVQRYTARDSDPVRAGRELGVEAVLDGSLQRANGRLRVSARLLDVRTGTARWARQWDLPWTDVFTVQDALATEVARELALSLVPAQGTRSAKQATSPEAYERYLRARYLVTRRTPADSRRAAEILDEVIALDPGFAPAYAVQADAYMALPWLGEAREPSITRARQAALRSLELDPTGAMAHAVLGTILVQFDWSPEAGEPELKRAFELDPDDPTVLRLYSIFLWHEGRFDDALSVNGRELAQNPTSVVAHRNRAMILYYSRRYDDCIAQCRKTLELDRYFETAYGWLARSYELQGREREAVEAYVEPLLFEEATRKRGEALRAAGLEGGLRAFWSEWLRQDRLLDDVNTDTPALAWLGVGDRERALGELERLCDQRSPWMRALNVEPAWDPIRESPRFQALLRRVNLVRSPS